MIKKTFLTNYFSFRFINHQQRFILYDFFSKLHNTFFNQAVELKFKLRTLFYLPLILSSLIYTQAAISQTAPNVWEVLRKEFVLNHEVTQPEVQNQLRWLVSHPSYLQKFAQSEPYMYHIITEIKKRHIPGEIALIPMIESSYDPFAYSGAGAAGLWQLMPGTGTDLGLKQDWWFDGRRSIRPATDAALNYLVYLNKFFNGDWILAFAAYDSGEGTMARIIKASKQTGKINFWSLPVPNETKAYIPRLLALAEIIQNPARYKITLPDIPHTPYFQEVNIGSQIDLSHAAKLAGISYHDLIKLNPGYNRWATAPYRPYKLLIPVNRVENFNRNLANFPEDKRVSWTRHQISAGDNLNLIAQRHHTTINLIKELNQLKTNSVKKGQYVLIPKTKSTATATLIKAHTPTTKPMADKRHFTALKEYKIIHIVQANESYAQIEKKYGISVNQIKLWNKLKSQKTLQRGQQLVIWRRSRVPATYVIKRGDNLRHIAKVNNIRVTQLFQLNPNIQKHPLHVGQRIRLG